MPSLHISEAQQNRLEELRAELANEQAGRYASVSDADLVDYLLDIAESIDDPSDVLGEGAGTDASGSQETSGTASESAYDVETETDESQSAEDTTLESMLKILENYSEKWQASDGEEPYEVELPNGDVETARTKDDVKAILYRHYQ